MKKFKLLFLVLICLCLIPNVYAADDVKIEDISIAEKSEDTQELTPASFSGLNINLDVSFLNENDYIIYKVVVNNDSNKDYKITNTTSFGTSNHIKYEYSYNDGNSIVKANSKETMTIKVSYARKVDPSEMSVDGTYIENKNMIVKLSRGSSNIINPKTSSILIVLIALITVIAVVSIIGLKGNKKVTAMLLVIALSLPVSILALDELQIKVNSKVTIKNLMEFCIVDFGLTTDEPINEGDYSTEKTKNTKEHSMASYNDLILSTYRYKAVQGMTFIDFKNSKYYNQVGKEIPVNSEYYDYIGRTPVISFIYKYPDQDYILEEFLKDESSSENYHRIYKNNIIKPCDQAVYRIGVIN